jgi:hypothetical protein
MQNAVTCSSGLSSPVNHSQVGPIGPVNAITFSHHQHDFLPLGQDLFSADSTALTHASENASCVVQVNGRVHFRDLALVHYADAVVIDNRLQPMSYARLADRRMSLHHCTRTNAEQRLSSEASLDSLLHESVCLKVDAACCFVAYNNLRSANEGAC